MVRTVHVTGIASAVTTAISLGAYVGARSRIAVLVAARQILYGSQALSVHPHRHTFSAHPHRHTFSAHPHRHTFSAHDQAIASAAFHTGHMLMVNAGALEGSDATAMGTFPAQVGTVHHSNVTGTVHHSNVAGTVHHSNVTGLRHGATMTNYTIDSSGRLVAAGTHPAADHAVLKLHGTGGPRIELGNVLRNNDILELTFLMRSETGGVF